MSNLIHTVLYLQDYKGREHTVNVQAYFFPAEMPSFDHPGEDSYFEIVSLNIRGMEFDMWELVEILETMTRDDLESYIVEKLYDTIADFDDIDLFDRYISYKV